MLRQELKDIKSGRHERHQFGIVMAVAACLIGAFLYWRIGWYPVVFVVGLLFALPVVVDKALKTDTAIVLLPLQKVWMTLALIMGHIVSTCILAAFFYGVFTLVRGANRFLGKPLLDTHWAPGNRDSYWIPREDDGDASRAEKQY